MALKAPEIYGYQTLHREIGYYISRLEQYDKSLKFFDEAIRKTPDDKRALIGRSRARTKVIQYEGALEDVNKALSYGADDLVVLADKALNTYLCCEFEEGLLQNRRLLPKRQKPDHFKMGVMQCSDAIENCLGERAGKPLRDHFKIIRKIGWKQNYAAHKPYEPKATNAPKKKRKVMMTKLLGDITIKEPVLPRLIKRKGTFTGEINMALEIRDSLHSLPPDNEPIPKYSQPFPFKPMQNYTTNVDNYVSEKYLDSMYLDKIFLKKLSNEPGANSPNGEGSKRISQLSKSCYKTVHYKEELLRTRRPFYFIKYQEARVSGALKERQKLELQEQQENTKKEAEILSNKLQDAYEQKELKLLLDLVEKLRRFCERKPKKLLPDKDAYMEMIYEKVCGAFYDTYRVNPDHATFLQKRRIYCVLGLPLSREPSSDSVVDQFKNVYLDYQKQIDEFSLRLESATSIEEICWYYHELARFQNQLNRHDLSRLYAKKCMKEAKSIDNHKWVFNSTMIMLKCNLAEHNKSDARNDLSIAMACAQALDDEDKIDYVDLCQDVVESVEFEDMYGVKQLEKRENKIIQMMASSKMKDEVAHLFRMMSAMPASRRMNVMPGVRASIKPEKKSGKSRAMSILPPKDGGDTAPKPTGLMDFID